MEAAGGSLVEAVLSDPGLSPSGSARPWPEPVRSCPEAGPSLSGPGLPDPARPRPDPSQSSRFSPAGGWRLAAGGWRLAAGGWRLAAESIEPRRRLRVVLAMATRP
jgi:hypothetical protein